MAMALVVPGAASAGQSTVLMGSTSLVEFNAPGGILSAPLKALQLSGLPASSRNAFHLEAERIQLEVDVQHFRGYGVYAEPTGFEVEALNSTAVQMIDAGHRPWHHLTVYPVAEGRSTIEVYSETGTVRRSDGHPMDVGFVFPQSREPQTLPTSGLEWQGSADAVVRGTFMVTLWDWDMQLMGADTPQTKIITGIQTKAILGLPEETTPAARDSDYRQAYILVENGVLTIPANAGHLAVFVDSVRAEMDGILQMESFVGQISDGVALQRASVAKLTLEGRMDVVLDQLQGATIPIAVSSKMPLQASADGVSLASVTPLESSAGGWPWGLGIGLVLLAIPCAGYGGRRAYFAWENWQLDRAEALLDAEDYSGAVQRVERIRGSVRYSLEAELVHVEGLVRAGRPAEALEALEQENEAPWLQAPAMREYLKALAWTFQGQQDLAREALRHSIQMAPALQTQAQREPAFSGFLADMASDAYA